MRSLFRFILKADSPASGMPGCGLTLLRISLGLSMALAHGLPKLLAWSEKSQRFSDPWGISSPVSLGLAVFAELFCSGLVVLGFATRAAAVPVVFTMATAFFLVHGDDPFGRKELAFVYGMGFLTLVFTGGGHLRIGQLFGR